MKEIPFSNQLQKTFYSNPKVEFLNISIDKDLSKWKSAIEKNNFNGNHLIIDEKETERLFSELMISGIPRYMIIDSKNKIVNINAPRPSDPKIREVLDELLKEK